MNWNVKWRYILAFSIILNEDIFIKIKLNLKININMMASYHCFIDKFSFLAEKKMNFIVKIHK